jgi:hypothetical protein
VLRAHRPRVRRVESDVYEPRAVELTANRGMYERHAQRVTQVWLTVCFVIRDGSQSFDHRPIASYCMLVIHV